jgi:hypothetical protein
MTAKLKACYNCYVAGKISVFKVDMTSSPYWEIRCNCCGACEFGETKTLAIAAWNRRTNERKNRP